MQAHAAEDHAGKRESTGAAAAGGAAPTSASTACCATTAAPIPATGPHLGGDLLLRAYREMKRLRLLDARMILLQRQGRVGFYGACTGQEATPIAAALAIEPDDWVFPALRESVMMLVRGFPLRAVRRAGLRQRGRRPEGPADALAHERARSVNQVSWSSCIGPAAPAGGGRGVGGASSRATAPSCWASSATARRASPTSTPR